MSREHRGPQAGQRVLITGITGFIGANLARALVAGGARVHGVVRPAASLWRLADIAADLTLHVADLNDGPALRTAMLAARPEYVLHLAFPHGHPSDAATRGSMLASGVLGTANLLEALRQAEFGRLVHVGSSLEYGPRRRPMRESDTLRPVTFRGVAKAAATLLCQQFATEPGHPVVMLRPFSVYGPWESAHRLVPTAVRAALWGEAMDLTQLGVRHDAVHVLDVVDASLLALAAPKAVGQVINVGSGEQVTNEAIVEAVQRSTGRPIRVRVGAFPPRPPDTTCWVADIRKARILLGWQPTLSLLDGIQQTVAWFLDHPELLQRDAPP
jgi:nucleoside-diphosphate-sugar epimerase